MMARNLGRLIWRPRPKLHLMNRPQSQIRTTGSWFGIYQTLFHNELWCVFDCRNSRAAFEWTTEFTLAGSRRSQQPPLHVAYNSVTFKTRSAMVCRQSDMDTIFPAGRLCAGETATGLYLSQISIPLDQGFTARPQVGAALEDFQVQSWLKSNRRLLCIAAMILAVIHPTQYNTGMAVLEAIRSNLEKVSTKTFFKEILSGWGCPFTQFVVTSNSKVPLFRSRRGRRNWLDLLLGFGRYTGGSVILPDIEIGFEYKAGTAIAIGTRILRHAVLATTSGDRMSFKFYIREDMAQWIDANIPESFSQFG